MNRLRSPFLAERSISLIVSSAKVMFTRRCIVAEPPFVVLRIYTFEVCISKALCPGKGKNGGEGTEPQCDTLFDQGSLPTRSGYSLSKTLGRKAGSPKAQAKNPKGLEPPD
jgi:hypothetical protein